MQCEKSSLESTHLRSVLPIGMSRETGEWRSHERGRSGRASQAAPGSAEPDPLLCPSRAGSWEFSFVCAEKFGHCSKTQTQSQSCFTEQNKLNWQMQFMLAVCNSAIYFPSREMWQMEASVFFKNSTTSRAWQSLVQTWHEIPIPLAPGVLREGLKQTPDLSWTHR